MTSRRSFLGAMLAAAVAPAFIKSGSGVLMPVSSRSLVVPDKSLVFESGEKTLLNGDILKIRTVLSSGVIVLSEYDVIGPGTCYGVDIYGPNFPTQVPRGSAQLAPRASRWADYAS